MRTPLAINIFSSNFVAKNDAVFIWIVFLGILDHLFVLL